ncbi:MAG: DUF222 domain-containing protein [Promicromonosporaceae bacterium]|nr:DUF222 domain-containing protein [Promicromonosporaceae bacterium]
METIRNPQPVGVLCVDEVPVAVSVDCPFDQGWVAIQDWFDREMDKPRKSLLDAGLVNEFRRELLVFERPTEREDLPGLLRALQEAESAIADVKAEIALRLGSVREVGLALRASPNSVKKFLGFAKTLQEEMGHTHDALRNGYLTEQRARIIITETACLKPSLRVKADELLCANPAEIAGLGTRHLTGKARGVAARLDQQAVVERNRAAAAARHVSLRPLPDGMCRLSATLPMKPGITLFAELTRQAERQLASVGSGPESRSRGAIMADTLVERVVGHPSADNVSIHLNLIMSDTALLGVGSEPATVLDGNGVGYGVIPAAVARNMLSAGFKEGKTWLRRIYATPTNGELVAATTSRRFFTGAMATWLKVRDQGICRTPYCDAPIRHLDHIQPHSKGGPTTITNGQGLCITCNETKDTPGWKSEVVPGPRHTVRTTTPSQYTFHSTTPPPPQPNG